MARWSKKCRKESSYGYDNDMVIKIKNINIYLKIHVTIVVLFLIAYTQVSEKLIL